MEGLGLEPYAAVIKWSLAQKQPLKFWQELIAEFLEQLGQACAADEKRVLGHIKCLARFPAGRHLRGSKISLSYPAEVEMKGQETTKYADIKLTLNVLVYGLPHDEAHRTVEKVGFALAAKRQGKMELLSVSYPDDRQHDHHDHEHDHDHDHTQEEY